MALPNFSLVQSLAIMGDANSDRSAREQGVRDALRDAGLPVPGTSLQSAQGPAGDMKVAYLIVPHGQEKGMIEDVCLDSVKNDLALECVDYYFECIGQTRLLGPKQISKARLHAFLASRTEPDLRLGEAAEKGIWQFDTDAFGSLKTLIGVL